MNLHLDNEPARVTESSSKHGPAPAHLQPTRRGLSQEPVSLFSARPCSLRRL